MSSTNRADVRDFLVTRRARITPQQAGLTFYRGNRRVPGLRREEVAMLAGVSADYYTRLEKGNLAGVSDGVLDAIAGNPLGRALYSPVFAQAGSPANLARFRFFDPAARDFYPNFAKSARTTVELLRTEAGRDPFNKSLTGLIGELSTRSEEFRALLADHNVRLHQTGVKQFHHPAVGRLDLMFEAMALEADEGLTLTAYTAEPGTPSYDGLKLLASWAATQQDGARAEDSKTKGSR